MPRIVWVLALAACHEGATGLGAPDGAPGATVADAAARVGPRAVNRCPTGPDPAWVGACVAGVDAVIGQTAFSSLGDAVAASAAGDTIAVCPGTRQVELVIDHDLTLLGVDPAPGATILRGHPQTSIIRHTGGALRVEGITMQDASAALGAAINSAGDLSLRCSTFLDNSASRRGGAVAVTGGPVDVDACRFDGNFVSADGGAISADATLRVVDSTFTGNRTSGQGGAIQALGDATVAFSTFSGNVADTSGGALAFGLRTDSRLMLLGDLFEGNETLGGGGAIIAGSWASDTVVMRDVRFEANVAEEGAAVLFDSWGAVDLTMERVSVHGNTATDGAAVLFGGRLRQGATARLTDSSFTDNTAAAGGSALSTDRADTAAVRVTATGVEILRNVGTNAAFELMARDSLRCRSCDFGVGADDNQPGDVRRGDRIRVQAPANFQL
ncbi:MAG TPA: hypothetical protein PKA64_18995 [Myxococcota bacterium]|nr:hypothetical protein [Myxococcota bacterium]